MNICEKEVLSNLQNTYKRKLYKIDDVVAIMDIGNKRKKQEDSVLISKHNLVKNQELLLVADGMGGLQNGAKASNVTAKEVYYWFQNLDKDTLREEKKMKDELYSFLKYLDDEVGFKSKWGGSTLVAATINEETIFVFNIGDSRAYIYDDKLKRLTEDHSYAQNLYNSGRMTEEDMRFYKMNNILTSWLGGDYKDLKLNLYTLDKKDIQKIFLCSDGVSDCISFNDFEKIVKTSDNICEDIINTALTKPSANLTLNHYFYYNEIIPGKDNVSLIYKKIK